MDYLLLVRYASILPIFVAHFSNDARRSHFGSNSVANRAYWLGCGSVVRSGAVSFRARVFCLLDAGLARGRRVRVPGMGVAWSWRAVSGWLDFVSGGYFRSRTPCSRSPALSLGC